MSTADRIFPWQSSLGKIQARGARQPAMEMESNARELNTVMRLLETFRRVDTVLPAQMAQCFVAVALRPGLTAQNLAEMTGLSQSGANRNIQALGARNRLGKPGLG